MQMIGFLSQKRKENIREKEYLQSRMGPDRAGAYSVSYWVKQNGCSRKEADKMSFRLIC